MSSTTPYPLPKFHFQVSWQGKSIAFTEATGLDFETEVIEYRSGEMVHYNKTKQPGLTKYSNVTLKRGTFLNDLDAYNEWSKSYYFQEIGATFRGTVTIDLLGEAHTPILTWTLANAWVSKV